MTTQSAEDPFAALNAILNSYNTAEIGPPKHLPLWLFARDPAGKVHGGLRGQTYWSWCWVDVLAVAEPYRRQGIGSRLLAKAEEIARSRGCAGIYLDTAAGRGTNVRLYLPVTNAVQEPLKPEPAVGRPARGTETLLLVEDNDAVRELSVRALKNRGYTVYAARSGEEAIEWLVRSGIKPKLLITDVVMPGVSGPNLAARLIQQNPGMRVLYVSGYSEDSNLLQGAFLGRVPLLQKPFTPSKLAERIRSILDTNDDPLSPTR